MLPLACLLPWAGAAAMDSAAAVPAGLTSESSPTVVRLDGRAVGKRFDGIGAVNGGGVSAGITGPVTVLPAASVVNP